nr:hypothetical protein CFP56_09020 [Quercus suber]
MSPLAFGGYLCRLKSWRGHRCSTGDCSGFSMDMSLLYLLAMVRLINVDRGGRGGTCSSSSSNSSAFWIQSCEITLLLLNLLTQCSLIFDLFRRQWRENWLPYIRTLQIRLFRPMKGRYAARAGEARYAAHRPTCFSDWFGIVPWLDYNLTYRDGKLCGAVKVAGEVGIPDRGHITSPLYLILTDGDLTIRRQDPKNALHQRLRNT